MSLNQAYAEVQGLLGQSEVDKLSSITQLLRDILPKLCDNKTLAYQSEVWQRRNQKLLLL
jgi:hypothetical protein